MNTLASTLGPVRATSPRQNADSDRTPSAYSRVLATAKEAGLMRRAPGFYGIVFGSLVLATAGVVYGFIVLGDTWYQLLIAAALGVVLTQFAFLTHEASHRQVFTSGKVNDRVGRLLAAGVVGISYAWWMNKHTRHHQHPNTMGKDPDIAIDTISFTEEDARTRTGFMAWLTRRQGYFFFPLLTLEGLNLHLRSTMALFEKGPIPGRALELTLIFLRLGAYVGIVFWLLPVGMAFAFIGVQMAVFGIYMGASFAPNHKGMPLISAGMKIDFFRRQVMTSRNIRGGFWMSMLYGGLNLQIEHHLFPGMARPHLNSARSFVKAACKKEGLTYTESGMMASYARVIEYLNRVGLSARDPFDCPAMVRYSDATENITLRGNRSGSEPALSVL